MMLTEADISVLYQSGSIKNDTPCAEVGKEWWHTLDEMFPLMKHERSEAAHYLSPPVITQRGSPTSAMLAGWICFGIGVCVSWFFPPGYVFFSVAIVMAIVAMATHQVSRGLILLLSSFLAMGVSAVISFVLAVGLFAVAAGHVITKVDEESKKQRSAFTQQMNQLSPTLPRAASPQFPTMSPGNPPQDDLTQQINQMNQAIGNMTRSLPQPPTTTYRAKVPNPSATRVTPAVTRPSIDTSVEAQLRRIEQQKQAQKSYHQQHDSLQRSIDYWEERARKSQKEGRAFAQQQVDSLQKQLQKLNSASSGM